MKKILSILILMLLFNVSLLSYDDISEKQINNNEKLIIIMYSEECPWCKWFKANIMETEEVKSIIKEKKITVKVLESKISKYPKEKLEFDTIPYVFVFKKGNLKSSFRGYLGQKDFIKKLNLVYK